MESAGGVGGRNVWGGTSVNFRLTLILLFVLAMVGGYFYFVELQKVPAKDPPPLWFYNTDDDNFNMISIEHNGKKIQFVKDEKKAWHFDDAQGIPVDLKRWGGITLLLRGPQTRRLLSENPGNLAPYGLKPASTVITVGTIDGGTFGIYVGDKTPDEVSHYVQMEGLPQLFLVDATWADVLSRLVTEPPYPPTPTPEADGS